MQRDLTVPWAATVSCFQGERGLMRVCHQCLQVICTSIPLLSFTYFLSNRTQNLSLYHNYLIKMKRSYYPQIGWNAERKKMSQIGGWCSVAATSLICNDAPKPNSMAAAKENSASEFDSWKYNHYLEFIWSELWYWGWLDNMETRHSQLSNTHLINNWKCLYLSVCSTLHRRDFLTLYTCSGLTNKGCVFRVRFLLVLTRQR